MFHVEHLGAEDPSVRKMFHVEHFRGTLSFTLHEALKFRALRGNPILLSDALETGLFLALEKSQA